MPWELTGNASTDPATNFLGTTDGQPLIIKTAPASGSEPVERVRITPDGKVGIGLQKPDATLHVSSITTNAPQVQPGLHIEGNSPLTPAVLRLTDGGTAGFVDPIHHRVQPPGPGTPWDIAAYHDHMSFALPKAENWVVGTIMSLFANGDVGIGRPAKTTARLHISSDDGMNHPQLLVEQTSKDYARLRFNRADKDTGEQVGKYWDIAVGGGTPDLEVMNFYSEAKNGNVMTLTPDGNVGIGTTTPNARLSINSGGAVINGVTVGTDVAGINYPYEYETVGISDLKFNLRLQSPNAIILHTGNPPTERMVIDTNGDITIPGDIILTNADCAEEFDIEESSEVEPGTVMVLDQDGTLHQSESAYDKRVIGVISGAGDHKPGIILGKQQLPHRQPIALVGKVYCKVDARYSPIEVGDLLTTSSTLGCAMKAADRDRAFGAVIGKALSSLGQGCGLIPIFVALQ